MNINIIERDWSQDEISSCSLLYNQIVKSHKDCQGTGLSLSAGEAELCSCEAVYEYVKTLIYSNLPRGHWGVSKDLNVFAVESDYKQIKEELPGGNWIIAGLGKTASLVSLGKLALSKGYNVFYTTSQSIIGYLRDDNLGATYLERATGADLVLVDDLEKYNRTTWADSQLEIFLRTRMDAGQGVIVSLSDLEMENKMKLTSSQKFLGWLEVRFNNKLFKKVRQVDYFSEPFLSEALDYRNISS